MNWDVLADGVGESEFVVVIIVVAVVVVVVKKMKMSLSYLALCPSFPLNIQCIFSHLSVVESCQSNILLP